MITALIFMIGSTLAGFGFLSSFIVWILRPDTPPHRSFRKAMNYTGLTGTVTAVIGFILMITFGQPPVKTKKPVKPAVELNTSARFTDYKNNVTSVRKVKTCIHDAVGAFSLYYADTPKETFTYTDELCLNVKTYIIHIPFNIIDSIVFHKEPVTWSTRDSQSVAAVHLGDQTVLSGMMLHSLTGMTDTVRRTFDEQDLRSVRFDDKAGLDHEAWAYGTHSLKMVISGSQAVQIDSACFMGEITNRNGCYLEDTYSDSSPFVFKGLPQSGNGMTAPALDGSEVILGWDTIRALHKDPDKDPRYFNSDDFSYKLITQSGHVYTGGYSGLRPVFQGIARFGRYRLQVHFFLDNKYDSLIFL